MADEDILGAPQQPSSPAAVPSVPLNAQQNNPDADILGTPKGNVPPPIIEPTEAAPAKKQDWWGPNVATPAQAFGAHAVKGAAEPIQAIANFIPYLGRKLLTPFAQAGSVLAGATPAQRNAIAPTVAAMPPVPRTNFAEQMAQNLHAEELSKRAPIASWLGEAGGGMIPGLLAPEALGAKIASPLLRGMVQGLQYGGEGGALQEVGRELGRGEELNPQRIAKSTGVGAAGGAVLGGTVSHIASHFTPRITPEHMRIEQKLVPPGTRERAMEHAMEGQHPYISTAKEPLRIGMLPHERGPGETKVPPSPAMRDRERAMEGQYGKRHPFIAVPLPHIKEEVPPPTKITQTVSGHIQQNVETHPFEGQETWRDPRTFEAKPASREQESLLLKMAEAKVTQDKAMAKLASAIKQFMEKYNIIPPVRRQMTPDQWIEVGKFLHEHGVTQELTKPYVESALPAAHAFKIEGAYKFKSDSAQGMNKEIKQLAAEWKTAAKNYVTEKTKVKEKVDRGYVMVRALGKPVNIGKIQKPKPYQPEQFANAEDFAAYKKLTKKLNDEGKEYPQYTQSALNKGLLNQPELKAHLDRYDIHDIVNDLFKPGPYSASDITVGIATTIGRTIGIFQKHGMLPREVKPEKVFAQVMNDLKASGLGKEVTPRFVQRLTGNQLMMDILEQYNPEFADQTLNYLTARELVTLHAREPNFEERKALNDMTPEEIKTSPALKGWTTEERIRESRAKDLDKVYGKILKGEIKRIDDLISSIDAKTGKKPFVSKWAGYGRYKHILEMFENDLHPGKKDPTKRLFESGADLMAGQYSAIFLGNTRVHWVFHPAEALTANLSSHPVASVKAARALIEDPIARDYGMALAGKGMMARLSDADKFAVNKWMDEKINDPLLHMIEGVPGGKITQQTISGELPERLKMGVSAVVGADHFSEKYHYPGGAKQFMTDYLRKSDGKEIPADRDTDFWKVALEVMRYRNKAVMHMPAGPLKERTVFQRHFGGGILFPFMRNIVQQSRVLTSFWDDLFEAIAKKNAPAVASAAGSIIFFHVLAAEFAGKHTLPKYMWDILDRANKPASDMLKQVFELERKHNYLGGRQYEEFGPRYIPILSGTKFLPADLAQSVIKIMSGNVTKEQMLRGVAIVLSSFLADNVAHTEGTENLAMLIKDMNEGKNGYVQFKAYSHPGLLDQLAGKHPKKLVDTTMQKTLKTRFFDWVFGGDTPLRAKLKDRAELQEERKEAAKLPK